MFICGQSSSWPTTRDGFAFRVIAVYYYELIDAAVSSRDAAVSHFLELSARFQR